MPVFKINTISDREFNLIGSQTNQLKLEDLPFELPVIATALLKRKKTKKFLAENFIDKVAVCLKLSKISLLSSGKVTTRAQL